MIIVFWNFFLIKLSTCSMDPETAVTCMMELEEKKRGRSYYLTRSRFLFFLRCITHWQWKLQHSCLSLSVSTEAQGGIYIMKKQMYIEDQTHSQTQIKKKKTTCGVESVVLVKHFVVFCY